MKSGHLLIGFLIIIIIAIVAVDRMYIGRFESDFMELEKQRIVTSNKLATAKIVYENLNHVRDLVFKNMDFPDQKDTIPHESIFFDFLTTCINDLKLTLISVKPDRPVTNNRITTYGYDIVAEGDFFKFGELCSKFENSRRIISLESFTVSLIDDRSAQGTTRKGFENSGTNKRIRVTMRVNTYRIKKLVELPVIMTPQQIAAARKRQGRR
jgi:Tfp pilus assembly protein PilO